MSRKFIIFILSCLLVLGMVSIVSAENVKEPETFTFISIGDQNTLDPHFAYDTGSSELIYQVYETLIDYKGSSVTDFEPLLSTEIPSLENGLISPDGKTYIFPIREGVKFSNGNDLSPEDVKYSFLRGMISDRAGGPIWMLYEPLFGTEISSFKTLVGKVLGKTIESKDDLKGLTAEDAKKVFAELDKKIDLDGNRVIFHLANPYPPFLNIVAKGASWSSILDKKWSIENGCWDGKPETIFNYHDPVKEEDPLYKKMMGTGPFILTEWVNGDHTIFHRNDKYWGKLANFKTVIIKNVDEWSTRKLMLLRGDADMIYAPQQFRPQIEGEKGITVSDPFPALQNMNMVFNWDINTKGNNNIGSGKLDGKGIPANFFADIHVRRAFSYCFDYKEYIDKVRMGEAIQLRGPIVSPLLGYDENSTVFKLDLKKAEEEFKKAFGGKLWEKGFKMTIAYNSGNDSRKTAADMLKFFIEQVNPKFNIEVRGVQWSTYLDQLVTGMLPASFGGWAADFPDPHNFTQAFLHSAGYYANVRGDAYKKWAQESGMDTLIEKGIITVDPVERKKIYKEIQKMSIDYAIDLWIDQTMKVNTRRSWITGYYPSSMCPGIDPYRWDK